MKRFAFKRITAFVLALIMTLSLCPVAAFAEEQAYADDQVYIATEETEAIPEEESAPVEEEAPTAEETEDSENDETVAVSEMATASSPAANAAATTHSHPICGKSCSCTSDSHPDFKWNAWDGTTTLGGGNYYLTKDVVLSKTMILNYNYITYLCLNGHSITCEDTVFDIYSTRSLYITDCVGTGVIETTNDAYTITNNRLLSVWGGTIRNSCEYAFSAILTGKNTSTYVRGGTVESSKYGDAIFSDVGSRVYIYDGNIKGYRSAIGGQDDTTDTIGTLTISGGHMSSTQGYGVLDIQNGSLTMSGGYVDGNVEVYDELGTTTISGGTINGFLYTYSGNTIVNGGEMEIDASGNTEIYAGTFHGENYFRGENTSIFGGNFATSTDSDVYIRGKTWICGGNFNTIWAYSGTPLYLSGVPEIDVIHLVGYPSALSAQSEDGSGSYGGDTIDLILAIPYTAEDWKDGEVVVKNVKSDAVAAKFAIAVSEGYTEHRYLERSGNNLVLRVPPHGTWGGGNNVTWSLIDGTLTISGTGALASADSGTKYPWGSYLDEITAIVVEPGITSIPNYAFEYCENATTISLPETLTSLNLNAFNDCGSLNNLLLPSSLTSISGFSNTGYPAFIRCESLTDLYYLGTAEEWDVLRSGKNITSCDSTMTIHFLQLNNSGATCTEAGKQPHYTFDKTSVYDDMYDMDKQPISQVETIPALGHRVVLEQAMQVRPVQIENTDTIPFVLENGNYYSNNHTHSSSSQLRIVATHACTLTLHYGVSSESTYDKFYILHNGNQKDLISGVVTGKELTLSLAVGDVVVVKYTKDGSASKNDDHGWVELDYEPITIAAGTEVSADILYPNCTDAVVCSYCDTVIKAASGHTFVDGVCSGCGATTGYCGDPQVNEGKDVIWVLDDGVMTISGTGDMDDYASVNKILGNVASVDYIVSRDWTSESITRAVIVEGVTSVGGGSFHGANYWVSALEEVSLPDSLKYIGDCAFEECDRLQEITIPKNVTSIREYAFKGCSNLDTITFAGDAPSRIETDAFNGVTATCYYPNNSTWTEAVRQDYGGDLTWISYSVCIEGHTWVDATCEEPKTCSVCGETEGDPLGHTEVIDAAVAPSCTATGLTEGKHCFVCDTVLIKQEVVDALGHDYESVVTAPTCTEQGYTTHTCAVCADSYVDTYVAATGHDYGEWFVITASSCTEKGKERHDCVNCDHFETREIAATGHTEVIDKAVAPTCTETGLAEGKHCSVCDAVLVVQEVVDAKGHDYGEFTPSDDEPSKTHKSNCTVCGYETTSAHTFGDDGVCTACAYAFCTITFNANGGGGTMAAQSVASGVATALNANAFTCENYTFAGWNTKADGTGDAYADEATITVTSATTLYAQWEVIVPSEAQWGEASGDDKSGLPISWISGTLTDAVKYANQLDSEKTAYIQLLTDVNTDEPLGFAEGKTTILDLNGYDIDRGLTKETTNGHVITVNGNLTLCDTSPQATTDSGKITGGYNSSYGGGVHVHPNSSFTMSGGTISENVASSGGGVYIGDNGLFTMNSGTISGNTTYYDGAGISCYGTFNLNGGTITENVSTRGTAGVHVYSQGVFNMTDGTISNNVGYGSAGVCLCTGIDDTAATFNMSGGSIVGNRSTWEHTSYSGVFLTSKAVMTVSGDATITGNVDTNGVPANVWVKGDPMRVSGELTGTIGITVDYTPSQENSFPIATGGGTPVYTITASDAAAFVSDDGYMVTLDATSNEVQLKLPEAQWGLATGENNDQMPADADWTSGTLTDAVKWANELETGTAYIQLLTDVNTEAPLVFPKTSILDLNGCNIDRGLEEAEISGNVITIKGNLTLCDTSENAETAPGKITGGNNHWAGGGVSVDNEGIFAMNGGSICGNVTESSSGGGGGVYVCNGTFILNSGSILNNTSDSNGGGVAVKNGSITINGGDISENVVTDRFHSGGGGVYVSPTVTLTMNGGTISGNKSSFGGGVYSYAGSFEMNGGLISKNAADSSGGGVYCTALFTMNGGNISGNTSNSDGGGVYASHFAMTGGMIKGNNSGSNGGVRAYNGLMQVSGTPIITGNVKNGTINEDTGLYENGTANNVYLASGKTITVTGALTENASIGVTTSTVPTLETPICIAKGTQEHELSDTDKAAFISDREYMNIFVAENMLMMEPLAHKVSFDMQGHGSQVDSQVIEDGQLVTEPSIPVEEGYVFEGWYRDAEYTVSWDFDADTVTESTTLYAKWRIADGVLWCEDIPAQPYTGKALKPDINVYFGMIPLAPNKDYTVSYKNNTKVYAPVDTEEELAEFEEALALVLSENPKAKTVEVFGEDVTIAKVPQIIIKGKGNFSGTLTKYFVVAPVEINEDDFLIPALSVAHTGKNLLPKPVVTWNETSKTIKWKTDYEVYLNYGESDEMLIQSAEAKKAFTDAGDYSLTVIGKGNFTGEASLSYTITHSTLMSKVKIGGWKSSLLWYADDDGVMQTELLLTDSTKKVDGKPYELVEGEGEDYTATYYNNTAVGTATVVFTGNPDKGYVGQVTKTFKITGTALSKMQVRETLAPQMYCGAYIEPQCTLYDKANGNLPTEAYTIEYSNNKSVGTATIIFTGNPECGYTGTLKKTFKITALPLTEDDVSVTLDDNENISVPYVKGGAKPVVTVTTCGGAELTEGVDYTIGYKNNTAVADAGSVKAPTVTIKFKGNYSGTVTKGFTITSGSLKNATVTVSDIVFNAKGFKAPTVTITDADGKKLSAGKDYDKSVIYTYAEDVTLEDGTSRDEGDAVEKNDIIPAKTVICVQVEGMGAYEDTLAEATFRVTKLSLAKATFKVKNQTYTGKAITIDGSDFTTAKCGTDELDEKTDYVIPARTYKNNINKGTASVVIQGTGNYGGTKTVTFKIDAKPLFWFF